ncbi:hypothetical protein BDV34DRAFT_226765 [Aspergillus parasiticus]|uniref:N-acetyltransferase domain-containing protein n=1 Tax=Aspergillus parasiticus TaxID=5067 RepID=A0A5N6DFN7_ASPPA|nr:hypothetical protein BDV34DRAFT_226765 [Aspergillus parasiticus]
MAVRYRTIQLPHDPKQLTPRVLAKYARLRLLALHEYPDRLDGLESHSTFSESDWRAMLTDPTRYHFICVADHSGSERRDLEHGTWVGMNILIGPLSDGQYNFTRATGAVAGSRDMQKLTLWHGLATYVLPPHRGAGAWEDLFGALVTFMRTYTQAHLEATNQSGERGFLARGFVKGDNPALREVYASLGAYEAARITHADAQHLNWKLGLCELIPDSFSMEGDSDDELYSVMEISVSC